MSFDLLIIFKNYFFYNKIKLLKYYLLILNIKEKISEIKSQLIYEYFYDNVIKQIKIVKFCLYDYLYLIEEAVLTMKNKIKNIILIRI